MPATLQTEGRVPAGTPWSVWKLRARPSKYTDEKDITKRTASVVPFMLGKSLPQTMRFAKVLNVDR